MALPPQDPPQPSAMVWDRVQDALDIEIDFETYTTADDTMESSQHMTESEIVQAVMEDHKEHTEHEEDTGQDDEEIDPEPGTIINTPQESLRCYTTP